MTTETTSTTDKQITIAVPEDRVPEFYAFYGRFLAGFPGRRARGRASRGCGPRHREADPAERQEPAAPESREA